MSCHSITLKIQNRGLGFFDWFRKQEDTSSCVSEEDVNGS